MAFCRVWSTTLFRPASQVAPFRRCVLKWPQWSGQKSSLSSVSSATEIAIKHSAGSVLAPDMKEINWDALSKDYVELFQSLQAVVESLGDEATADHPMR